MVNTKDFVEQIEEELTNLERLSKVEKVRGKKYSIDDGGYRIDGFNKE